MWISAIPLFFKVVGCLIDADGLQSKAYKALQKAHKATLNALKPGSPASAAYKAALDVMEREGREFDPHLTKTSSTGIGINFGELDLIFIV